MAAAALASVNAFAAIAPASSGNGELILTVFDDTAKVSYLMDLGVTIKDFRTAADAVRVASENVSAASPVTNAAYSANWSLAGTEFSSFVAASNVANWRWVVTGGDSTGSAVGSQVFATTVTGGDDASAITTGTQKSALTSLNAYVVANNAKGDAANVNLSTAQNGSVFGSADNGLYALGVGNWLGKNAGKSLSFSTDNALGSSSVFNTYIRAGSSNTASTVLDTFDNVSGQSGLFSLKSTANGYALNYTLTAAPVPEPSSYALMLAGLMTLATLAKRRRG
ncbi:PEP-CTERM sorting domain-containing protein [Ideonella sp. DXS22W]|uniref:PEP-CTERM sorting domain-containing protein n=1 Tax=Pseudaquabacterium inlustre TaxID=2984192 RepID=A0ABU9CDT1_9BURK